MRYLLDALYLIVFIFTAPWLLARKSRRGLWSRFFGSVNCATCGIARGARSERNAASGGRRRIWFHGVSVGEIHLLRGVIARFRERFPDCDCFVSSTTDTGFAEAQRCFPDLAAIRWPLDFSWAVERALRIVQPELVVLAESELWPNFLLAARRRRIPVVAVNVRLSPRSLKRYERFHSLTRRCLNLVAHFAVQTDDYAASLKLLGVPCERITVTGSVKYDGVCGDRTNPKTVELRRLFHIADDELVWVAGSTQEPEEEIVLAVWQRLRERRPNLRLIIVPRQRDRFDGVAQLLERNGVPFARRSELASVSRDAERQRSGAGRVILVDTIGELSAVWGLADIAFVGGSLDGRRGGQNMIEPAASGAAVLFGPNTWNFRDTVQRLLDAGGALVVNDAAELGVAVGRLLEDGGERHRLGEAARALVQTQQGATERTMAVLSPFLTTQTASQAA